MDEFMAAAIAQAQQGLAEGGIPIGSVLVKDDKIVGQGHNKRVQDGDPVTHAEIDCLRNAGRIGNYKGTTLYSTLMPCYLCAGAVVQFGIKKVMLISLFAWVLRFGLFAYGNPADGLWMIIVSCIVYGMAFDFFNISGSLFVETTTDSKIRSSAQGLFMMMSNGVGAYLGTIISSWAIGKYYILANGQTDWHGAWLAFAIYALVVAVLFGLFFRHKHNPDELMEVTH